MNAVYSLSGVRVDAGSRDILNIANLTFAGGQLVTIAGPNGAGKSTLLSVLSGLRKTFDGECLYRGRDVRSWPRRLFAREVAIVLQNPSVSFPFVTDDVVLMGRMPYSRGWFESLEDLAAVEEALRKTGANELKGRDFRTLSGGEQQRVLLAAALAQEPKVLLLDEQTAYLDLQYQVYLYRLLLELRNSGVLVITITHDLNLAAAHSDRMLLLKDGHIVADGAPEAVLTADLIQSVFRVEAQLHCSEGGKTWIRYGA